MFSQLQIFFQMVHIDYVSEGKVHILEYSWQNQMAMSKIKHFHYTMRTRNEVLGLFSESQSAELHLYKISVELQKEAT